MRVCIHFIQHHKHVTNKLSSTYIQVFMFPVSVEVCRGPFCSAATSPSPKRDCYIIIGEECRIYHMNLNLSENILNIHYTKRRIGIGAGFNGGLSPTGRYIYIF